MVELSQQYNIESSEKPTHNCGIGLLYTFTPTDKAVDIIDIGNAVQHRGQNGVGLIADTLDEVILGEGLLKDAIKDEQLYPLQTPNTWTMVHLRYGTNGGYGRANLQPLEFESEDGEKGYVAVNGNIPNVNALRQRLPYSVPEDWSDTNVAKEVLKNMQGANWDEKILNFSELPEVRGSANNMFVGMGENVYVLRDEVGLHPLVMGEYLNGGGVVLASESMALQKIGARSQGEFPRGAVMKLSRDGIKMLKGGLNGPGNRCIFEPAYFMGPNSSFPTYESEEDWHNAETWMSVLRFRLRCGGEVAREFPVPNADYVVGMPDSGVPFAQGFANASGLDYIPAIIRSHYNGRTFIEDKDKEGIPKLVKEKLMPVNDPYLWKDKVVVVGDDSLVRGNNAREITTMLRRLNPAEIHWRLGFPKVVKPCHLGISFRDEWELLAAQFSGDVNRMANEIGADSIRFISNEGILRAGQQDKPLVIPENMQDIFLANGWCGGCVTGKFPVDKEGNIFSYNKDEERQRVPIYLS